MPDLKKLMFRVKNKMDTEKLTINSQMYFIEDTAVFIAGDLALRKCTLSMAWLEGELLKIKTLYEPQGTVTIQKALTNREKEAMLIMVGDGAIVVVSSKDPKGCAPQVIKQQAK